MIFLHYKFNMNDPEGSNAESEKKDAASDKKLTFHEE
jgi:hypothetical protein